jgi:hypothetical protein
MWQGEATITPYCSIQCSDIQEVEYADELFDRLCMQCSSVRMLGTTERHFHRLVNICEDPKALLHLLPYIVMIILYYESFRQLVGCVQIQQGWGWDVLFFMMATTLSSIFPIFYAHDMLFLYMNDNWYQLFIIQLFLTVSMDLALCLRLSNNRYPNIQAAIHGMLVTFNIVIESDILCARNLLFLLDNMMGFWYGICVMMHDGKKQQRSISSSQDLCKLVNTRRFQNIWNCLFAIRFDMMMTLLALNFVVVVALLTSQRIA